MDMGKKHLLVLFGGCSSEHEVSCRSVVTVIRAINRERYELLLVGITKDGHWIKTDEVRHIEENRWQQGKTSALLSPEAGRRGVWLMDKDGTEFWPVDLAFPVLHGAGGEDGAIQGLLSLARIPYVGCGILASALSMDKLYTKQIVQRLGIRQADFTVVYREELSGEGAAQPETERSIQGPADGALETGRSMQGRSMQGRADGMSGAIARVEEKFAYPIFIKPSSSGSSCGVSKAENREQLKAGLLEAARHGRKILVEERIVGREVECAVLGGRDAQASGVGEVLAAAGFYDYDAKYNNPQSQTVADPQLPGDATEQIRRAAVEIFRAVDGWGLARVDFFVEEKSGAVVFNEINTMPGFTSISMYPFLWEARGLSVKELVERLLENAGEREE